MKGNEKFHPHKYCGCSRGPFLRNEHTCVLIHSEINTYISLVKIPMDWLQILLNEELLIALDSYFCCQISLVSDEPGLMMVRVALPFISKRKGWKVKKKKKSLNRRLSFCYELNNCVDCGMADKDEISFCRTSTFFTFKNILFPTPG